MTLSNLAKDALQADRDIVLTAEALVPVFYEQLRCVARQQRRRIGALQTMQTTAVISEAYLKLRRTSAFNDRTHFLRAAALAMRHVLISYARDQSVIKRGNGVRLEPIENADFCTQPDESRLIEVNDALSRLKLLNLRLAQVVECRFFAGYSEEQTAEALGLSDRTVRRDWDKARAWLRRELAGDATNALTLFPQEPRRADIT